MGPGQPGSETRRVPATFPARRGRRAGNRTSPVPSWTPAPPGHGSPPARPELPGRCLHSPTGRRQAPPLSSSAPEWRANPSLLGAQPPWSPGLTWGPPPLCLLRARTAEETHIGDVHGGREGSRRSQHSARPLRDLMPSPGTGHPHTASTTCPQWPGHPREQCPRALFKASTPGTPGREELGGAAGVGSCCTPTLSLLPPSSLGPLHRAG